MSSGYGACVGNGWYIAVAPRAASRLSRTLANALDVTEPSHTAERVPKFERTLWPNSKRAVGVVVVRSCLVVWEAVGDG